MTITALSSPGMRYADLGSDYYEQQRVGPGTAIAVMDLVTFGYWERVDGGYRIRDWALIRVAVERAEMLRHRAALREQPRVPRRAGRGIKALWVGDRRSDDPATASTQSGED